MVQASGFLLSMLSSIWRGQLAQQADPARRRCLELDADEADAFHMVFDLGSGLPVHVPDGLDGLLRLGRVASRHGVWAVLAAIEDELLRLLTMDTCGEILSGAIAGGLHRVEVESRRLALDDFQAFAVTDGFMALDGAVLASLLDDDSLREPREEAVFELVVCWIHGRPEAGAPPRDDAVLSKIRFPLMDGRYLLSEARDALPDSDRLQVLVLEALALQQAPPGRRRRTRPRFLEPNACRPRAVRNIDWAEYACGGESERRLPAAVHAFSLALGHGRANCGLIDGRVRAWRRGTLEEEEGILTGHIQPVRALAVWGEHLISASDDTEIKVWPMLHVQGR